MTSPLHRLLLPHSASQEALEIGWIGPSLDDGPMPALFYFALSLETTLLSEPYCRIAQSLLQKQPRLRIFSATLPYHRHEDNEQHKIALWIQACLQNPLFFDHFFKKLARHYKSLEPWVSTLAFCGLSRGAWISTHLTAALKSEGAFEGKLSAAPIALLAPMGSLSSMAAGELEDADSLKRWDLVHLPLASHPLWLSLGHQDSRVGTCWVFDLLRALNEQVVEKRAQHQLVLYPSIGYKGHGTPDSIFDSAASWLLSHLHNAEGSFE